jgi:dCTP deaminase
MILTANALAQEIKKGNEGNIDGISVIPEPNLKDLVERGEASVSLRLGRWFLTMRQTNETVISPIPEGNDKIGKLSKQHFVPFSKEFVLHPNRFVLACTLEWIRLPSSYAAFVVGKSSLGRRGIIIETAAGIHPGFCGCLTLEIANVGEIPVQLFSAMMIGQLFVHRMHGTLSAAKTPLAGQRKPRLGEIRNDEILEKLRKSAL